MEPSYCASTLKRVCLYHKRHGSSCGQAIFLGSLRLQARIKKGKGLSLAPPSLFLAILIKILALG